MIEDAPVSLKRSISPPPTRSQSTSKKHRPVPADSALLPSPAAVEAGEAEVRDHLQFFSEELGKVRRVYRGQSPALSIEGYRSLYTRNQGPTGHHFVIHQHDHPVAGVHYDLRLQFSETSSLSFSIPYGLPGNPNSRRPNRMAIETRVHNLWNNLIESASQTTGSLLIWDTGEYEVLPRRQKQQEHHTDDELSSNENYSPADQVLSQADKLAKAFKDRHIHLRLHGSKLPQGYSIALRLPKQNDRQKQPRAPKRRRRRTNLAAVKEPCTSDTGDDAAAESASAKENAALQRAAAASDDEAQDALERETIRSLNAYPGADNSIGSVHQRHWFLSLDREPSGFVKAARGDDKGRWIRKPNPDGTRDGFDPFYVLGRDEERSVVTGRLAADVMDDAGVKGYMGRKMWRPIME